MKRQDKKDKNTKKDEGKKTKRQRPKREYDIATSGQFRTLAMFFFMPPLTRQIVFIGLLYVCRS